MIDLAYIASPSYSGSTLLTFLLNAHPEICTIGELKWGTIDLATYRCSCGELLTECDFWRQVGQRVEAAGLPFDLQRPLTDFRLRDRPLTDRVVRARVRGEIFESVRRAAVSAMPVVRSRWQLIAGINRAMIQATLDLQRGSVFLDGSKEPVRIQYLMETGDYNIRVIHLIRDGRGVLNSTIKNKGFSPEAAALDWLRTHEQLERLAPRLGARCVMQVRYEDICADPPGTCRRIFEFLGLNPAHRVLDYRSVLHHILGNSMRLRESTDIQQDEKWRAQLSPEDLSLFERLAGERNRRYGYA